MCLQSPIGPGSALNKQGVGRLHRLARVLMTPAFPLTCAFLWLSGHKEFAVSSVLLSLESNFLM